MTPSEENDDDGEEEDGDNKDQATDESDEEGDSSAMSDTPGPVKEQPSSEQRLKEGKESGDRDNSQVMRHEERKIHLHENNELFFTFRST